MKSYVIIGLGRFGTALAIKLQDLGNEVMVIDESAEQVQKISNRVTYAVVGDARDEEVLISLGVRNVDCAVVAVGSDLAASILITLNLKALGVDTFTTPEKVVLPTLFGGLENRFFTGPSGEQIELMKML